MGRRHLYSASSVGFVDTVYTPTIGAVETRRTCCTTAQSAVPRTDIFLDCTDSFGAPDILETHIKHADAVVVVIDSRTTDGDITNPYLAVATSEIAAVGSNASCMAVATHTNTHMSRQSIPPECLKSVIGGRFFFVDCVSGAGFDAVEEAMLSIAISRPQYTPAHALAMERMHSADDIEYLIRTVNVPGENVARCAPFGKLSQK